MTLVLINWKIGPQKKPLNTSTLQISKIIIYIPKEYCFFKMKKYSQKIMVFSK